MRRSALAATATAALLALSAAPAGAKLSAQRISLLDTSAAAPTAVKRTCSERLLPAGTPGVSVRNLRMPMGGYLRARLSGSPYGADWDLAVFDTLTGRLVNGSAAFGGNEVVDAAVVSGDLLTVQACHRSGSAATIPLTVTDTVVSGSAPRALKLQIVRIPFKSAAQVNRLAKAGLDLNETSIGHTIDAIVRGPRDLAKIRRAGLGYRVRIADLAAYDRKYVRTALDPVPDALAAPSGLPSGRTSYRRLVDYQNDLKALVESNRSLVRPVILPRKSVEGRTIEGVEIATGVERTDDGRPTHVEMGLHHVREWPSGELTIEYGIGLVKNAADPRVKRLLDGERTFILPVINPDGLEVTQTSGTTDSIPVYDDNGVTSLPLAAIGVGPYRRKNCASTQGEPDALPCLFKDGVDLNRNYGAFWGGPGESPDPGAQNQTYRGPGPFSEPETQAVHEWSSQHQIMVLNSNHTYAGDMLFQPGFARAIEPGMSDGQYKGTDLETGKPGEGFVTKPVGQQVPYQKQMKALSDAMANAAAYVSEVSYKLYDVTGATEDWNYFAQGTFGYTTESAWQDFHPDYQDGVVDQYLGTLDGYMDQQGTGAPRTSKGLQESFLLAGEAALDPANHAIIEGDAPPGATLSLDKTFTTSTSYVEDSNGNRGAALQIPEHLHSTLTVPASGHYVWHVNPSTRPIPLLNGQVERWTLSCGGESRQVEVEIGERATENLTCAA